MRAAKVIGLAALPLIITFGACTSMSDPSFHKPSETFEHPILRKAASDYRSLTEPERVWYKTSPLIFSIRNGGLISYYYNGYAEHVEDLIRSLDTLGAADAKRLVLEMNALFGPEVPRTLQALNEAISSWPDSPEIERITDRDIGIELAAAADAEARLNAYAKLHGIEP